MEAPEGILEVSHLNSLMVERHESGDVRSKRTGPFTFSRGGNRRYNET